MERVARQNLLLHKELAHRWRVGREAGGIGKPQSAHDGRQHAFVPANKNIPAKALRSIAADRPGNSGLEGMRYVETEPATVAAARRILPPFEYKRTVRCVPPANLCSHDEESLPLTRPLADSPGCRLADSLTS